MASPKFFFPNAFANSVGSLAVITASNSIAAPWQLFFKRLFDIGGGIIGCLITLCIYPFVAIKIKKADPGPIIFGQMRIGKNGRQFRLYKFRSMFVDAEERKKDLMDQNEVAGPMFKIKDDPRIIPGIGKFIRNYSIDELPQFFNILKRDMSLVGTRPPTIEEFEHYEAHHKARLSFKPGLTGLWQVSGRNRIDDFERVVFLDKKYIEKWNLREDIKILAKTVIVVLQRKGSM